MAGQNCYTQNESTQALLKLSYLCSFPMAVKLAIFLKVPDILSAESTPLTAKQIADRIPGTATSEAKLERLLLALSTYGLFAVSGSNLRSYSLTPMSRLLAKDENGLSLSSMFFLNTETSHLETLQHLHESVLEEGVVPFEKAYGGSLCFRTLRRIPRWEILVDVGGGTGLNCNMIKSHYPHISPINFDLPFVIAKATKMPGIEHRGGSMFESVPSGGDAILLKTVLHNWDDTGCGRLLSNCYSPLASADKLVIIECLLAEETDMSSRSRLVASFDLAMMTVFKGGKERTAPQFQNLVESAGFKDFKVAVYGDVLSVMEAYKI
ncbi:hypothetical protein KI387_042671, partial [Taxus chinensis]